MRFNKERHQNQEAGLVQQPCQNQNGATHLAPHSQNSHLQPADDHQLFITLEIVSPLFFPVIFLHAITFRHSLQFLVHFLCGSFFSLIWIRDCMKKRSDISGNRLRGVATFDGSHVLLCPMWTIVADWIRNFMFSRKWSNSLVFINGRRGFCWFDDEYGPTITW